MYENGKFVNMYLNGGVFVGIWREVDRPLLISLKSVN